MHGCRPVVILVAGVSDGDAWITVLEKVNLVELALVVFMGVGSNTMIEGEGDVAVLEEGDDIVHVFLAHAAG